MKQSVTQHSLCTCWVSFLYPTYTAETSPSDLQLLKEVADLGNTPKILKFCKLLAAKQPQYPAFHLVRKLY
jgi:hypothetical protein